MEANQKKTLKTVLSVIGIILVLIAVIKLSIIGFYPSEGPLYYGMVIVALILLYIAKKIKIVNPGEDKAGLTMPDKWKCRCGSYNDKSEAFCGNCGAKKPYPPA